MRAEGSERVERRNPHRVDRCRSQGSRRERRRSLCLDAMLARVHATGWRLPSIRRRSTPAGSLTVVLARLTVVLARLTVVLARLTVVLARLTVVLARLTVVLRCRTLLASFALAGARHGTDLGTLEHPRRRRRRGDLRYLAALPRAGRVIRGLVVRLGNAVGALARRRARIASRIGMIARMLVRTRHVDAELRQHGGGDGLGRPGSSPAIANPPEPISTAAVATVTTFTRRKFRSRSFTSTSDLLSMTDGSAAAWMSAAIAATMVRAAPVSAGSTSARAVRVAATSANPGGASSGCSPRRSRSAVPWSSVGPMSSRSSA